MRGALGHFADSVFELPPHFPLNERRRAGVARAAWQASGGELVEGHEDYSVIVDDPGGTAWLRRVGSAVTDSFGIVADLALGRHDPVTTELCAACDLVALHPGPLHFEASLPGLPCILLRGVALPIDQGACVQLVLSWREVLDRAATARLKRDLTAALRSTRPVSCNFDPFAPGFLPKHRS